MFLMRTAPRPVATAPVSSAFLIACLWPLCATWQDATFSTPGTMACCQGEAGTPDCIFSKIRNRNERGLLGSCSPIYVLSTLPCSPKGEPPPSPPHPLHSPPLQVTLPRSAPTHPAWLPTAAPRTALPWGACARRHVAFALVSVPVLLLRHYSGALLKQDSGRAFVSGSSPNLI